jgi:O-antigen/teichoic acid export membrane protein
MLSLLTRPEVVGWYGAPTRLFQTLMFLPVLISTAWLPRLVAAFEESPAQLRVAARMPVEFVLVLSVPIAAGTAIIADPLIHGLYGSAYANAVPVMVVLGLCIPPMYLNIMLGAVVIAENRQMAWTWAMIGATIVNPPLNLVLIPLTEQRWHNGAIGAAISLLVTELLIVVFGFFLAGRGIFGRAEIRRCVLCALASLAMVGIFYVVRPTGTLIALTAAVAGFAVLAVVFRIVTPAEAEFVKARLRRS